MGLDIYIERRLNHNTPNEQREELIYFRKDWDILGVVGYTEENYAKDMKLSKKQLIQIRNLRAEVPDFFDGFHNVEALCEIVNDYDELCSESPEGGRWEIVLRADW